MKKAIEDFFTIDVILGEAQSGDLPKNGYFSPQIDIYENKKGIFIEMELPGVRNEDVKVFLNNNKLVINGEKKCSKRAGNIKYYLLERPYGFFEKILEIPRNVDTNCIEAYFRDGVLTISMFYKNNRNVTID